MTVIGPSTRVTSYSPVTATTAFPIGFPIFDSADVLLLVNGVETAAVFSGSFVEGVCSDGVLTVTPGVTGTVLVVGLRDPRRTDQFLDGRPLPVRDHNYALNRLTAENQEARRDVDRALKLPIGASAIPSGHYVLANDNGEMVDGGDGDEIANAQGYAAAARADRLLAQAAAATINLPPIGGAANKNKQLRVRADGLGYELRRNPFYDPYEYNATGNGSDDTAAILACQLAAGLNEGLQAAPAGRGMIVLPPGVFRVTQVITQYAGERWLGMGGAIQSTSSTLDTFIVDHSRVSVVGIQINAQLLPTANMAGFHHRGGSDCNFRDITVNGGYYGFRGSNGAGGVDSNWDNLISNAPYAHSGYFIGYQGLWLRRAKFDAACPVAQPTNAQLTGAMVNGAVYASGDMVTSGSYWFQCLAPGTAPAAGGITPAKIGDVITTSGTATWLLVRASPSANLWIDSGCFIFKVTDSDISGGHDYSIYFGNTLASTAPQDMYFHGVEAGGAFSTGVLADAVDALQFINGQVHSLCRTNSVGIQLNTVRTAHIGGNRIRGLGTGVQISASAKQIIVDANHVFAANIGVDALANASRYTVVNNGLSGSAAIWGLVATGVRIGTGNTNFRVADNDVTDCTTAGVTDSSDANAVGKRIRGNY